jgi:hypothetical protein
MTSNISTKTIRGFDPDRSQAVRNKIEKAAVEKRGHGKAEVITPSDVKLTVRPTPRGRFEPDTGFAGLFSSLPIGQYIED